MSNQSIIVWLLGSMASYAAYSVEPNTAFHPSIEVSGQALYLQTSSSSLNVAGYQSFGSFDKYENAGNNWGFGYQLEGRYQFLPAFDVDLNWYSIDSLHSNFLAGPMTDDAGAHFSGNPIQNTHQARWNAVNIEAGVSHHLFAHHQFRLHAGFEFVNIGEVVTFTTNQGEGTDAIFRHHNITYNGFGPRIGGSYHFNFIQNSSVYVAAAAGSYAGTAREDSGGVDASATVSGNYLKSMFLVPELEMKLGGRYSQSLSKGTLTVDGGWLWINYFNALITRVGGIVHAEAFGFQGPYLGLKYRGEFM